ncbi:MAG: SPASM domain-containing protein, partial [Calditrichota bacterium]
YGSAITWDKQVIPCCFDKDADFKMGEVGESEFSQIWDDDNYERFRKMVIRDRDSIEMCQNCTEGLKIFIRS